MPIDVFLIASRKHSRERDESYRVCHENNPAEHNVSEQAQLLL